MTEPQMIDGEVTGEEDMPPREIIRREVAPPAELTVDELVARGDKIKQAMEKAMTRDEHYGVVPGTQKPTLLKPGAEKLCSLFMLDPEYRVEKDWQGDHLTATATCTLFHIPSGNRVASGVGLCSTRESKYAYRQAGRKCPACGVEAIIWSKKNDCYMCIGNDKGGCWTRFPKDHPDMQAEVGKVPNPELPDTYNTVLKMACKRALVAAVLNSTGASEVFTQDVEDAVESASSDPAPVNESQTRGEAGSEEVEANGAAKQALRAKAVEFGMNEEKIDSLFDEEQLEHGMIRASWVAGNLKTLDKTIAERKQKEQAEQAA